MIGSLVAVKQLKCKIQLESKNTLKTHLTHLTCQAPRSPPVTLTLNLGLREQMLKTAHLITENNYANLYGTPSKIVRIMVRKDLTFNFHLGPT